jgi:RNA polymerase sigma-70 factor (ECF subfamily)
MPDGKPSDESPKGRWLPETHWTDIMAARREGSQQAAEALNRLCSVYWYPVYAYARRRGLNDEDAKDITQGFFHHVLERNLLGAADRTKGKFRSFLLASLNYYMSSRHEFETAKKRGGGSVFIPLDDNNPEKRYAVEPATELSPERLFERRWALELMEQALTNLREDYRQQEKEDLFNHLRPFLNDTPDKGGYFPVASALGMTPGAVATAVHRLRHRYGELIDAEIARTVASANDIPHERQHLYQALSCS